MSVCQKKLNQDLGFCFQILIRPTNNHTTSYLHYIIARLKEREKKIVSIQYRQKEVVCLFVHVDRLNKRETFDAHCINVCVVCVIGKKVYRIGQNRSKRAKKKLHPPSDCDLSFVCFFFPASARFGFVCAITKVQKV